MTVNVITSGGGQYIVNVLNAVAAWTGGGGFRSMLQVVMVMGLGYSLLIMALSLNWKVLFNWFLSATAMYLCMIVPTTTVVVSDTINPAVGNGAVANVPLGLAVVASFSSQANNWLTNTAESVFTMPASLEYTAGGMVYLTTLDTALLSMLGEQEVPDDQIEAMLDDVLTSSLWTRRLQHRGAAVQQLLKTGLVARAKFIWGRTTATQRRGYFLAGVGLATGEAIDADAAELNELLVRANGAILVDDADQAIAAVTAFAKKVFGIAPFVPDDLTGLRRARCSGTAMHDTGPRDLPYRVRTCVFL